MTGGSPYLTRPTEALEKMADKTVPGMAHWAGSGPPGTTCGKCKFYGTVADHLERMKLKRCKKYLQLTGKVGSDVIPGRTPSCRHFEAK